MPLPAGLDPALNPDPRAVRRPQKKGGDKKGAVAVPEEDAGTKKKRKKKTGKKMLAENWMTLILKIMGVLCVFFGIYLGDWLDYKLNGMLCMGLLRVITKQQRKGLRSAWRQDEKDKKLRDEKEKEREGKEEAIGTLPPFMQWKGEEKIPDAE